MITSLLTVAGLFMVVATGLITLPLLRRGDPAPGLTLALSIECFFLAGLCFAMPTLSGGILWSFCGTVMFWHWWHDDDTKKRRKKLLKKARKVMETGGRLKVVPT